MLYLRFLFFEFIAKRHNRVTKHLQCFSRCIMYYSHHHTQNNVNLMKFSLINYEITQLLLIKKCKVHIYIYLNILVEHKHLVNGCVIGRKYHQLGIIQI